MFNKLITVIGLSLCIYTPAFAAGGGGGDDGPPSRPKEYKLAVKAVKIEDYSKAISLLQTVIDEDPKNADAWNYMGYSLRHLKQYDDALAAYKTALKIKPKHKGALEYLGELYLQIGQLKEAKVQLEKLDKACFFSCKEYRELKERIEKYESG